MNDDDKADYQELIQARETLERQIELTLIGAPSNVSRNRGLQVGDLLRTMREELAQIKEIIANMEADDAQGS